MIIVVFFYDQNKIELNGNVILLVLLVYKILEKRDRKLNYTISKQAYKCLKIYIHTYANLI